MDWQEYFQEFSAVRPIEGKESVLQHMRRKACKFIVINGLVYRKEEEPIYELEIMGNNNGLNLHLSYVRGYRYSALERQELKHDILSLLPSVKRKDKKTFQDCFIEVHDTKYVVFHKS